MANCPNCQPASGCSLRALRGRGREPGASAPRKNGHREEPLPSSSRRNEARGRSRPFGAPPLFKNSTATGRLQAGVAMTSRPRPLPDGEALSGQEFNPRLPLALTIPSPGLTAGSGGKARPASPRLPGSKPHSLQWSFIHNTVMDYSSVSGEHFATWGDGGKPRNQTMNTSQQLTCIIKQD